MPDIPPPDADAQAHSGRLRAHIAAEIRSNRGAIPFSRFMELALYAPALGYYSAGATKFGAAGDFVTAPELGPLFAACVADALAPVLQQLGPDAGFLEIGGGSGAFAEVALKKLMAADALPSRYAILEPSADLRARQREHLRERLVPPLFDLVEWPDAPFQAAWDGVVFANEVVDALPTPRFTLRDGEVFEEHVALGDGDAFVRTDRPADALLAAAVRHVERQLDAPFADGYRSELLPQLPYWVQAVVGPLRRGALLFVDYGYPRREYYRADRLAGYCSQASFLVGNGLDTNLAEAEGRARDEAARFALRQQAKRLALPGEMGERFQAMGFERGVSFGAAFLAGDLAWRL
jgi:SAM-dependent MidA family methyltransferase